MKPVVRNVQNDKLYFFEGGNTFRNVISGEAREVDDETARKIFRFNVEATIMLNENPVVEELVKRLNLKIDVGGVSG